MPQSLSVRVITARRTLFEAEASEIIVPAHDGEVGVLPQHEDFIGLLGTGVLKLVREGNDYWFMVSRGIFEVSQSQLVVLAEEGATADEVDLERTRKDLLDLEARLLDTGSYSEDFDAQHLRLEQCKALLEIRRRSSEMN